MKLYLHLTGVLMLSLLAVACGGGGSTNDTNSNNSGSTGILPTNRVGYAIDDYVVDGTVIVYQAGTTNELFTTTTGELGSFTLPNNLSGILRVDISGGYEDIDGLPNTTGDRKPFTNSLSTLLNADDGTSTPFVVSALTTGINTYADGDFSKFQQALNALPTDVKKLADLSDVISDFTKQKERFETVKTMTRVIGFEGLVNELQDDGHLNQSNSSTDASSLASVLQDVKPQGRLIPVKDTSLRMCIAAALQTTPDAVSYNQLLSITDLSCVGAGVTSITGIGILKNLEYLNLANNDIIDINPLIDLSKLSWLSIFDNRVASVADLNSGSFTGLGVNLGENCITDLDTINGNLNVVLEGYTSPTSKQYTDCNKNAARVTLFRASISPSGEYRLLYRATHNSSAVCTIEWGDGQIETARCDAKPHARSHIYAMTPAEPVIFKINGIEAGRVTYNTTPIPSPSLSIVFNQSNLDTLGATGLNFELITGRNGGAAAKFAGINNPGHIRIPNRPEMQFTDAATFDMWVRADSSTGMDGWGSISDSSVMSLLAKSHDRTGLTVIMSPSPTVNSWFATFDPTWSDANCQVVKSDHNVLLNTWFRVTMVASSTAGTAAYINKELMYTCSNARPSFDWSNGQDLYIGKFDDYWYPLDGAIQDVNIYKQALTKEQVQALP